MQMHSEIIEKKFDILKWHWRKQHKPEDIGEGVCLWAFAHRPAPPFPASTPGPPSLPPEAGIERGGGGGLIHARVVGSQGPLGANSEYYSRTGGGGGL
jgi:hypothetical protein